ncbi:glycosyl hydrolase 108 family protein [Aureispira sp. CCB-E]|uniref:glycosyl hydrolase 108 family protein n=1 Tax=Aureispira sp. CCB-E TaxID=3051121 RepID=UPI002868CC54|nr:glycosyl hydrolase 108 family protein [Aureispira sp. CCB-E]WMX17483.1 glycosyl hydrolase 108 family protein [Aureispira sp. CCB-E]
MASFEEWVKPGKRRYRRIKAGYQNHPQDPGNYTGGKIGVGIQAGTNMSIAAPTLSNWRGHPVTAAEMQTLTEQEALQIYRQNYWNKILGTQIKSQTIADFLADMKSSGGGVKNMQRALNDLGESLAIDGVVGPLTLGAINRQIDKSVARLNNAFRKRQIEYYNSKQSFAKSVWLKSLDKDYPAMSETAEKAGLPEEYNNKTWIILGIGLGLLLLILLGWMLLKK